MKEADSPIKKRRKTAATPENSLPAKVMPIKVEKTEIVDVYHSVIKYEEEESRTRDADADQDLYMKTCNKLRNIMNEMATLKSQNIDKSNIEMAKLRKHGALLFIVLKKLNRLEKFRTKGIRDSLNKVKQHADYSHLQLQNLLYEILHLKKEVNKCLQFKSKDEEIDLVPVEEFYKEAPANISRPSVTKKDEHQLRLARLEWELQQRKDLSAQCQKKDELKKEAAKKIVAQRERLDNLSPQLKTVLDATKPLQEFLCIPLDKIRKQHILARLLPQPLFILYVQADAYKQACDPRVSVLVRGDEDAARSLSPATEPMADDESDSEQDSTQMQESSAGRHRKASTRTDRQEERRRQVLKTHPLMVEVTMRLPDDNVIILTFSYLLSLNVVTVLPKVEPAQPVHGVAASELIASHRILLTLLPRDTGHQSLNPSNAYLLRKAGLDGLPADLGIPYVWTQHICGMAVIGNSDPIGNEALFRRIKKRLASRLALCRQVQQLEEHLIEVPHGVRCLFPAKLHSNFGEFESIVWEDYLAYPYTQDLIMEQVSEPTDTYYRAVLVRGTAKVIALITVKADYPVVPAIFCLNLRWHQDLCARNSNAIRDMEREMNVYWKEYPQSLAAQLLRLQACFDIFLESSSWGTSSTEFPREKVFFRAVRGRDRSVPYKYLQAGGGVFTHR